MSIPTIVKANPTIAKAPTTIELTAGEALLKASLTARVLPTTDLWKVILRARGITIPPDKLYRVEPIPGQPDCYKFRLEPKALSPAAIKAAKAFSTRFPIPIPINLR